MDLLWSVQRVRVSAKGQACIDEFVRHHPQLFTHTSLNIPLGISSGDDACALCS
jgi:hypothetical protein